ncbi:MAG: two-component regulator propeller domain-containing protein [bacterium]
MRHKPVILFWGLITLFLPVAYAGFEIRDIGNQSDYLGGKPVGISIDPDGRLALSGTLKSVWRSENDAACWTVACGDGVVYAATADEGRVYRYKNHSMELLLDTPQVAVLSLLTLPRGRVLAGSAPDGIIYSIDAAGVASVYARTDTSYIWKMLLLPNNTVLAATGIPASLKQLDLSGKLIKNFDIKASHVRSMTQDSQGKIWFGTAEPARVYCLDGDDLHLVHEARAMEITAVAAGKDGVWFSTATSSTISNTQSEYTNKLRPQKTASTQSAEPGELWFIDANRSVYRVWTTAAIPIFDMIVVNNSPYLVCGADGFLFRIDDSDRSTLLATRQFEPLTSLAVDSAGVIWVGGATGAELLRYDFESKDSGTLESAVIDAGTTAVWGRLHVVGSHVTEKTVAFESRTGNTPEPDNEWSDWRSTGPEGKIQSPPARFFQWKTALKKDKGLLPVIDKISVSVKTANCPPYITRVTVHPVVKGALMDLPGRGRVFQQTMPDGLRIEYTLPTGAFNGMSKGQWMQLRGMRTVSWEAGDADNNALLFDIDITSASGEPEWFSIARNLDQPLYSFDSTVYSDGLYRIRVIASDSPANPHGENMTAERTSLVFEIDNTPPTFKNLNVNKQKTVSTQPWRIVITGQAVDNGRRVSRLEYTLDTKQWFDFTSSDGMLDQPEEQFELLLEGDSVELVPSQIFLRVTDDHENVTTSTVSVE